MWFDGVEVACHHVETVLALEFPRDGVHGHRGGPAAPGRGPGESCCLMLRPWGAA